MFIAAYWVSRYNNKHSFLETRVDFFFLHLSGR